MVNKTALSKSTKKKLAQLGIPDIALDHAMIEVDTYKSRFITWLLHSNATVIGRTIYFRSGSFSPESRHGLALIAHELVHVMQWQEYGVVFLFKYLGEYILRLAKYLIRVMRGDKPARRNWVHDEISHEKRAIAVENAVLRGFTKSQ